MSLKTILAVILGIALAAGAIAAIRFSAESDPEPVPVIRLETSSAVTSDADSDGDGSPDWLEDLSGSDAGDMASFPYQKDIARARSVTVDNLLYDGPGEFTEEIVRRFILGTDTDRPVSAEEKEEFITTSVEYFSKRAEERALPVVDLSISDTVPKQETLNRFLLALDRFASSSMPVDVLAIEVFAKNTAVLEDARNMRASCDYTLATIPRRVPKPIYDSYYLVLERITYLCEALTIALTANTAENFFYVFRITNTGKQFDALYEDSVISEGEAEQIFIDAVLHVVEALGGDVS